MSEVTPNELVKRIGYTVRRAQMIATPIDPTLTIQGEAADAKATGDAIAAVLNGMTINGKSGTNKVFVLYGSDILVSSASGAQTLNQAIEAAGDKNASEIMYDATNLITIADALDDVYETLDSELSNSEIDAIFDEVFEGGNE